MERLSLHPVTELPVIQKFLVPPLAVEVGLPARHQLPGPFPGFLLKPFEPPFFPIRVRLRLGLKGSPGESDDLLNHLLLTDILSYHPSSLPVTPDSDRILRSLVRSFD